MFVVTDLFYSTHACSRTQFYKSVESVWAAGEKNGERKHAEDEIEWEGREQLQARRRAQRASVCVCTYPHKSCHDKLVLPLPVVTSRHLI